MTRILGLAILATTALSTVAFAAPERIRGTVSAISSDSIKVHTATGDETVKLSGDSKYLTVKPSTLAAIDKDTFIGTATKDVGGKLVALEVVVFPNAMKGTGEGHYAWDRLPDTTVKGSTGATSSMMTNGTVQTATTTAASANTTMTNGSVATSSSTGGAKQLTVTYKGGEQHILVPPTAPIVLIGPGAMSDVTTGKQVVVVANEAGGGKQAAAVIVGTDGANPPM